MSKGTNESIISFVRGNSYMTKQCSDVNDLMFSTRRNCWGGQCGEADVLEAQRIKAKLIEKFDNVNVEIGGSDEWVSINIEII